MDKKLKVYKYSGFGKVYTVAPFISHYNNNGRLAVVLEDVTDGECFAVLTVNIDDSLSENSNEVSFVDTNNLSTALKFIKDNKLGEPTGWIGMSGYCTYSEVKFNLKKLNSLEQYEAYNRGELKYEEQ